LLTVPAGETAADVTVPLFGDTVPEAPEDFSVDLGDAEHAVVQNGSATGVIVDDDLPAEPTGEKPQLPEDPALPEEPGAEQPKNSDPPDIGCGLRFVGTASRDRINGTSFGDRIEGAGAGDIISGQSGDDCLIGGPGRDRISGDAGFDNIMGGAGADQLFAVDGAYDFINCGRGRDRVRADAMDRTFACEKVQTR
jgi:Ca2+-binding RTX toxin-like protein